MRWDPSYDADRYIMGQEAPLECPICDAPNDDDGEPVYPADPVFCSATCAAAGEARRRADAEADAGELGLEDPTDDELRALGNAGSWGGGDELDGLPDLDDQVELDPPEAQ